METGKEIQKTKQGHVVRFRWKASEGVLRSVILSLTTALPQSLFSVVLPQPLQHFSFFIYFFLIKLFIFYWTSLIAQLVKDLPAMQETPVQFFGQEHPLEKGQATHSSILGLPLWLSWLRIHLQHRRPGFDPWVGKVPWRRERLPTQVFGVENSLDCIVHGVAKSWTQLSDFDFHLHLPLRCSQLTILLYFQVNNEGTQTCIYMYLVQSLSCVLLFVTLWTAAHHAFLSFTLSRSLVKLMFIESVMPSNHLILCHLLFLLPSIFPSIRVFSSESVLSIRQPQYWSFSFSISPSNEYSGNTHNFLQEIMYVFSPKVPYYPGCHITLNK